MKVSKGIIMLLLLRAPKRDMEQKRKKMSDIEKQSNMPANRSRETGESVWII